MFKIPPHNTHYQNSNEHNEVDPFVLLKIRHGTKIAAQAGISKILGRTKTDKGCRKMKKDVL